MFGETVRIRCRLISDVIHIFDFPFIRHFNCFLQRKIS